MTNYLAAVCPKCSKWIPIRGWYDSDAPTFDPSLDMKLICPHCTAESQLLASAVQVVDEAKLDLPPAGG